MHQAFDIFHNDDGIIDQQADRQHHAEQRERVDGIAEQRQNTEGPKQNHRHGHRRDQGRAPALQENEHDDDDQPDCLDQSLDDLIHRKPDEGRRIARKCDAVAIGQTGRQLFHLGLYKFGGLERVRARGKLQRNARPWMPIQRCGRGVAFVTQLDPRDIGKVHD